ncbi:MAG: thiamine phosphate synthase [Puniceicoccales bacterium]|jgi:thiamine-phosphate pyrophosphorylase|nr:thiamine phosphate synthase [Puniceicoccales bacterium]
MALRKILNWLTGRGEEAAPQADTDTAPDPSRDAFRSPPRGAQHGGRHPGGGERRDFRRGPRRGDSSRPPSPPSDDAAAPKLELREGEPFSVVISTPDYYRGEHEILEGLFEAGLSRFHLRKNRFSFREWCEWVEAVPEKWLDRIVVHAQPVIAGKFSLGGLHLRAGSRIPDGWSDEIPLSYSCSNFDDLARSRRAQYATLGPVFPSLDGGGKFRRNRDGRDSEPQRTPEEYSTILESWRDNPRCCPVLALGGISAENVHTARELGFAGFAVVGAVWDAEDPVAGFQALHAGWSGARR